MNSVVCFTFFSLSVLFIYVGERGPGSAAQEMIEVDPHEVREKRERENRKKLTGLLEKIEGCSVSNSSLICLVLKFFSS